MSEKSRDQMSKLECKICDLAVAYNAYCEATNIDDERRTRPVHNSIVAWGTILEETQNYLGIELVPPALLRSNVRDANDAMTRIDAIMSGAVHEDGISPA